MDRVFYEQIFCINMCKIYQTWTKKKALDFLCESRWLADIRRRSRFPVRPCCPPLPPRYMLIRDQFEGNASHPCLRRSNDLSACFTEGFTRVQRLRVRGRRSFDAWDDGDVRFRAASCERTSVKEREGQTCHVCCLS